jgi:hypothetical protein
MWSVKTGTGGTRPPQVIIMLPKKQALFTIAAMIDEKVNVTPRFFG